MHQSIPAVPTPPGIIGAFFLIVRPRGLGISLPRGISRSRDFNMLNPFVGDLEKICHQARLINQILSQKSKTCHDKRL